MRRFLGQPSAFAMTLAPLLLTELGNGLPHLLVRPAPADVAGQGGLNLLGRPVRVFVQGGTHGDDESRRAEPALLGVVVDERGRYRFEFAVAAERLGRLNLGPTGLERQGQARVDRAAV